MVDAICARLYWDLRIAQSSNEILKWKGTAMQVKILPHAYYFYPPYHQFRKALT